MPRNQRGMIVRSMHHSVAAANADSAANTASVITEDQEPIVREKVKKEKLEMINQSI
jgi:hypothetical protein